MSSRATGPIARAQEPVLSGVDAPDDGAVVSVFNQISIGACSGALVADNVVLTTRRCVAGIPTGCCQDFGAAFDPSVLIVQNADSLDLGLTRDFWSVKRVVVPPAGEVCGNDLALLVLTTGVASTAATPLAPRLAPVVVGDELTVYGYGPTTPNGPDPGQRRKRAHVPVTCVDGCAGAAANEWVAGEGLCAADGPATDTAGELVGVAARIAEDCTSAVFESLSAHAAWLSAEVRKAADEANETAPAWALEGEGGASQDPDAGPLDPALCVAATPEDAGGTALEPVDSGTPATGGNDAGDGSGASVHGRGDGCSVSASRGAENGAATWLVGASLALVAACSRRPRRRG